MAFLRAHGHDATSVVRDYIRSLRDRETLEIARRERRVLITNDKDFGELIYRLSLPHRGVILFRLGDASVEIKETLLLSLLQQFSNRLETSLVVVTENKIRFRQ